MKKTLMAASVVIALAAAILAQTTPPAQGGAPQRPAADPRSAGGGNCSANPYNCVDTPNPLAAPDTVWMEDMTWMDVRDAVKAGKTTVIVSTGGIEPNGPWLALGKHNFVLKTNCDAIARKLGNALCAPIVPFVPEGSIDPKSGHMVTVGTISLEEATFEALLTDIARSYRAHGFQNIVLIGDSGGNQEGMKNVADKLTAQWGGKPAVVFIPEYYAYNTVAKLLVDLGVTKEGAKTDALHDDPGIALNMFMTDPNSIRWEQRVKAGKATIDGVSLADKRRNLDIGRKIVDMRATNTVAAIRKALAANGK
jgi:creatinine amidohydrolase/Fe(II)-dependent formamide hydrolase-like protein